MAKVIQEFDSVSITNASIQYFDAGVQQEGTKFGCIGTFDGETEIVEIVKKCEGFEVKKRTKALKTTVTVAAHVPIQVFRNFYGLSNTDLKPGIYAYGTSSKGKNFVFTADIVDEFEDVTKMIAFSNCTSASGLKFTVENGADEVALIEFEFTALPDKVKEIYYEALIPEVEDESVIKSWHTQFTPDLVKLAVP